MSAFLPSPKGFCPEAGQNFSFRKEGASCGQACDVFGDTNLLKGYKLFNWHSDLPDGVGYGPMFYDIALEIATKTNPSP